MWKRWNERERERKSGRCYGTVRPSGRPKVRCSPSLENQLQSQHGPRQSRRSLSISTHAQSAQSSNKQRNFLATFHLELLVQCFLVIWNRSKSFSVLRDHIAPITSDMVMFVRTQQPSKDHLFRSTINNSQWPKVIIMSVHFFVPVSTRDSDSTKKRRKQKNEPNFWSSSILPSKLIVHGINLYATTLLLFCALFGFCG